MITKEQVIKKLFLTLFILFVSINVCLAKNTYNSYGQKTGSYKQTSSGYNSYDKYGSKTGSYAGNNYSYTSVWSHISKIYELLRNVRSYANDRAQWAYDRGSTALSRANSAYNLAETKVSTSTYRNHKHYLQQDLFTFTRYDTAVGNVVDISQYGSGTHTVKLQQDTGKPI